MHKFIGLNERYSSKEIFLNMSLVRSIEPSFGFDHFFDGSILRYNANRPYEEYQYGRDAPEQPFHDYIEVKETPEQIMEMINA